VFNYREWDTNVDRRRRSAVSRDRYGGTLSSRRRHHDETSDRTNTGTWRCCCMSSSCLAPDWRCTDWLVDRSRRLYSVQNNAHLHLTLNTGEWLSKGVNTDRRSQHWTNCLLLTVRRNTSFDNCDNRLTSTDRLFICQSGYSPGRKELRQYVEFVYYFPLAVLITQLWMDCHKISMSLLTKISDRISHHIHIRNVRRQEALSDQCPVLVQWTVAVVWPLTL